MSEDVVTTTLKLPKRLNDALRTIAAADHRSEIAAKHAELLRSLA